MMRIDLDALFASAPTPYLLLDPELRMVWANDAYLAAVGRTRDALIGRLLTEEFPAAADSASDQMLRGSFRRVLTTRRTDHLPLIPYPIESADGHIEERYWSATHSPILDSEGRVEFILQNTEEVTDLYQIEKSGRPDDHFRRTAVLRRAEAVAAENHALGAMTEFFQAAFDQAPSFMAILNGPEHVFQIANQSYTDLIGGRDVIGLPVREALPDIADQGYYELLDRVFASGEPVSFRTMPARFQATPEERPVEHFVDFIAYPIKDASGGPLGVFVQGHDVTGQKIAEKTVTAIREKFRTMAQSMPNHVWTTDQDGGLTWLNKQTYAFTGYQQGELLGANWAQVVHPDDRDAAMAAWAAAFRHQARYETEFRIRGSDGSYRWHLVRATPLLADDGTTTGWVGTNTDIEDRKNAESEIAKLNATLEARVAERNRELEEAHAALRQSQKMEAIGNLAGGIAHDFNNLLQVITGNLQLAARAMPEASPGQARLEQAMNSVKRGATLASQLLSFARKQPLAPQVVNLRRFLEGASDILDSAIGEGVRLNIDIEDGLWNTSVDPSNMENALLNLAINARDAMEGQGELTIDVANADLDEAFAQTHPDVEPGSYVTITVSDTGCGISPEVREHIFEPFFTTKADGYGTGLGLSMVYGFARQSGGHIAIESAPGSGARIRLYLPRSLEEEQRAEPAAGAALSGGTETILLVEDDEDVRETAANMLTDLGYDVLQAAGADQALSLAEDGRRLDLLFTDIIMPGEKTGRDLAQKMREMRPDLPVLFTSGYAQDSIVHDGRLDEGVQLLGKPYTQSELDQKLREVLGGPGGGAPRPSPADAAIASPAAPSGEQPRFDGVSVVVCEDDMLIRMDIAEGLRLAGCAVWEAGSANEALDLLNREAIDLLITDMGLPDRTGEELAQDARQLNAELPVIFATGDSTAISAAPSRDYEVLSKPFRDTELLDAVEKMLSAR